MMIDQIQRWLESIYLLPSFPKSTHFLVDHDTVINHLGKDHPMTMAEEVVLFRQTDHEIALGLYLAPGLLNETRDESPKYRTHRWMTVVEGISHLLFLHYKIQRRTEVSHLEMELQAEIDKYLFIRLNNKVFPELIPNYHLRHAINLPGIESTRQNTYEQAQRLANRYCQRLEKIYLSLGSRDGLFNELRQFYRRSHWDKLKFLGYP